LIRFSLFELIIGCIFTDLRGGVITGGPFDLLLEFMSIDFLCSWCSASGGRCLGWPGWDLI